MGIFAKRAILEHEELTFNYNVDRYGFVRVSFQPSRRGRPRPGIRSQCFE